MKLVNEALGDILKPKDDETIANELVSQSIGNQRNALIDELKIVERGLEIDEFDELFEFIFLISNDYMISALDMYLPENKRKELYDLFKQGYNIATYSVEYDDFYNDWDGKIDLPDIKGFVKSLGWKQFWFEDNMDQGEFIFVKAP